MDSNNRNSIHIIDIMNKKTLHRKTASVSGKCPEIRAARKRSFVNNTTFHTNYLSRCLIAALTTCCFCLLGTNVWAQTCAPPNYNDPALKSQVVLSTGMSMGNGNFPALLNNIAGTESGVWWSNNVSIGGQVVLQIQFPQAIVLKGFETTGYTFVDGTVRYIIQASTNGSDPWVDVTGEQLLDTNFGPPAYGAASNSIKFPMDDNIGSYTHYRLYGVSGATNWDWVSEIYFSVGVSAGVSNLGFDWNTDLFDPADDFVTLDLDPLLVSTSGTYTVTTSLGDPTPTSGTIGTVTSFNLPPGSMGAGPIDIIITDVAEGCSLTETIPDQPVVPYFDTDLDSVGDHIDEDDDNDGILDVDEEALCMAVDYNVAPNKQMIVITKTATTAGSQGQNPSILLNGNLTETVFWYESTGIGGAELVRLQFPSPTILTGMEYYIGNSHMIVGGAQTKFQGSNDGSTWEDVSPVFTKSGNTNAPGEISGGPHAENFLWDNSTAYTYYRHLGISGNTNRNPWVYEIFFRTEDPVFCDTDEDGIENRLDLDSDNDGIPDNVEGQPTLTYVAPANDSDATYATNNGINSAYLSGLSIPNSDTDPYPDFLDTDSEGDGILDKDESGLTFNDDPGDNGLDSGSETVDDYTDVNGRINNPGSNLQGDGNGQEVDYRRRNINATAEAVQAACAGPSDSPLTSLVLTGADGAATRASYSVGTIYFGPDFAGAPAVSNLPSGFAVADDIENPEFTTYYVVRAFFDEVSFRDFVLEVNKKVCSVTDLSVAISNDDASANAGENVVYTVTLTNNGPDPAVNVQVRVDTPDGLEVLTNTPTMGTYSSSSQLWEIEEVPLGDQTLTITYRMR